VNIGSVGLGDAATNMFKVIYHFQNNILENNQYSDTFVSYVEKLDHLDIPYTRWFGYHSSNRDDCEVKSQHIILYVEDFKHSSAECRLERLHKRQIM